MKICHNCGRELEDSVRNCIRCNEEQYDDAVIFKTSPKPPPEVKIRNATQPSTPPPSQAQPMGATQPQAQPTPPTPQAEPMGATQPQAQPTQPPTPQAEPLGSTQEPDNTVTPPVGFETDATIDQKVLDEIIASETTDVDEDEGKTKTNSMSVLILLILVFVIVLIIIRPLLLDALVPSSPSYSVQVPTPQAQAQPQATPQEEVVADTDTAISENDVVLSEEFVHIEHIGKTIDELDFDVSLQNENTYGFTDDGVSILFTVDGNNSITNVQYKSNYVVNSTDADGIEKNIATVTEICNMFGSQNALELDDTNALSLTDLTSSSFIDAGIETATYKAMFTQDDVVTTVSVDYSLVAGLYSVVQLIDFSNGNDTADASASASATTDDTATNSDTPVENAPAISMPMEVPSFDEVDDTPIASDSPETGVADVAGVTDVEIEGTMRGA